MKSYNADGTNGKIDLWLLGSRSYVVIAPKLGTNVTFKIDEYW